MLYVPFLGQSSGICHGELIKKIIRFKAEILQKPRCNFWGSLKKKKKTTTEDKSTNILEADMEEKVIGQLLEKLSAHNGFAPICLHNSRTPRGTGQLPCVTTEPP